MVDNTLRLPTDAAGLFLTHNEHKGYYITAGEWLADREGRGISYDWPDEDARARAIAADEIWALQWYPNTPIGCYTIMAPTLAELLAFAARIEGAAPTAAPP